MSGPGSHEDRLLQSGVRPEQIAALRCRGVRPADVICWAEFMGVEIPRDLPRVVNVIEDLIGKVGHPAQPQP